MTTQNETRKGVAASLAAYLIWGFFPLFFKALATVAPAEVLTHRIIWSVASCGIYLALTGELARVRDILRSGRSMALLAVTTLMISTNWYVFIQAVETGHVLESSLGYFITPLVSVLLGYLFLGERLKRVQKIAIALAFSGVAVKALTLGQLPVISLALAASFGGYGLARKYVKTDAVTALTVETLLLAPLALAYALHLAASGKAAFLNGPRQIDFLLVMAGVVTAVPLVLYGAALERLKLSTVGLLQYIVPTMQFALAVWVFGEPFTGGHMITFALIWAGLAAYTLDAWRADGQPQPKTD